MSIFPQGKVITAQQSFETGEVATVDIFFPSDARVVKVRATVLKAIAGTDNGTITVQDSLGATLGTITVTLSATIGTDFSVAISDHKVAKDSKIILVPAKTTAGGELECFIEYFDK